MNIYSIQMAERPVLLLALFAGIFTIAGCAEESLEEPLSNDFSDLQAQQLSERVILDVLAPKDSVMLGERYGILNAIGLSLDVEALYIRDYSLFSLFVINKQSLELENALTIPEGRGPGELSRINSFAVSGNRIVLVDQSLFKIQIRNREGEPEGEFLVEEAAPWRVSIWEDGTLTFLSTNAMQTGSLFYTLDSNGHLVRTFGDVSGVAYNPIRYDGEILVDDGFFYFAGYFEHVLGKWNRDGDLVYAVSSIDDFPGEANYSTSISGEQSVFGFVPEAFFSAVSSAIYNDYWIITHRGDWDEEPYVQYIDIYNKHNGQYLASIVLPSMVRGGSFVVDEGYIYTLHSDSLDEVNLFIYENTLDELLGEDPGTE